MTQTYQLLTNSDIPNNIFCWNKNTFFGESELVYFRISVAVECGILITFIQNICRYKIVTDTLFGRTDVGEYNSSNEVGDTVGFTIYLYIGVVVCAQILRIYCNSIIFFFRVY